MLRLPRYSFALLALGVIIGGILGGKRLAFAFGGVGAIIGYLIWLRARLLLIRAGKPFHIGSFVNVLVCTCVAVGLGIVGVTGDGFVTNGQFWTLEFSASAIAVWLHWKAAKQAGTTRLLPTTSEFGQEFKNTIVGSIKEPGEVAMEALFETIRDARRSHKHGTGDRPSHP
jgi:hypothetical protein